MTSRLKETICAIATPMGEGAISVIRLSGELAVSIVSKHFLGKQNLAIAKSHTAHFGRIVDSRGNIVDDVVCTLFRTPTSFTGEDIVEISCHGGNHVTRRVLECFLETGAHPAEPGEFTQRAFLNGKLDLSQAEAVADLIQAQSEKAYKISLDQLEGSLSREILVIRDQLTKLLGLVELELDFVEEDIKLVDKENVKKSVQDVMLKIEKLLNTYKYGKVWHEGVRVALVGVPNAGKSSLLNALLDENRAIVTNIPGTTRDFIEGKLIISGVLFRITDTAGLRTTKNPIEKEGVKRSLKIAKTADIVVLVHDCTEHMTRSETKFLETLHKKNRRQGLLIVNSKIDLREKEKKSTNEIKNFPVVETSAISHNGVLTLRSELARFILSKERAEGMESVTVTNERHYSALQRAKNALVSSLDSVNRGESNEFIAVDLRMAIDAIGEIVGLVTTEEILNDIFSRFCIGK
jgi:tRNA modification GTPase